jgi:hypothetical protein
MGQEASRGRQNPVLSSGTYRRAREEARGAAEVLGERTPLLLGEVFLEERGCRLSYVSRKDTWKS